MPLTRRAVLGVVAAGLLRPALAADTWRMVTEYPATTIPGEGIASFAATVARLSDGGLVVQPGFDGLRSAAMMEAVAAGEIDAADAFTGALAAKAPILQLSALPFLTASLADTGRLLAAARPAYVATLAARGLSLLYATPWPASGIWSRRPLPDAASLQGLRIRTYDAAGTAVFQAAGAAPVQVSFADAMPRLRSGELDAVLSSGDGGAGARLWELLPNFTVLDYASPLSLAFCRAAVRQALPEATRRAIDQAADETEARQFRAMTTRNTENETRMRSNGVSITTAPELRAKLVDAAGPVIAEWRSRAGTEAGAALDAYR